MKKKIVFMLCCLMMLANGCAGTKQDRNYIASILIPASVSLDNIKSSVINTYMDSGWKLEKESDHIISFLHQNDSMKAAIFFGSQYDTRVFNRETVVITSRGDGFMVRANQEVIGNYGSAFEKKTDLGAGEKTEQRLLAIKSSLIRNKESHQEQKTQQPVDTKPLPVRRAE